MRELIALSHRHGIKAYVWTHELDVVPEHLMDGGKVAAFGNPFWQWMAGRYTTLFDALPELDGVVVTLTETHVPIDDDNLVTSPLTPPERFEKMGRAIHDVLSPRGKEVTQVLFCPIINGFRKGEHLYTDDCRLYRLDE